jgi:hypothetical protein
MSYHVRPGRRLFATAIFVSSIAMIATFGLSQAASAGSSHSSGLATAEKALAPYTGHPSVFPVTEKLHRSRHRARRSRTSSAALPSAPSSPRRSRVR